MRKYLLITSVCVLFSTQVNAESIKPYIGLDLGATHVKAAGEILEGSDTMMVSELNFGLKFNQYFGLEVSSQASTEKNVEGLGDLSYSAVGLDAVGYVPLNTNFDLFAMAGVGYYNFDLKINDNYNILPSDLEVHATNDETAFRVGLGVQYNINDKWSLRGMAKYHHIDNKYFDYIGDVVVGVRYTF